ASQSYTVTINPPLAITTPSLTSWTVNYFGYSQTIATSGGTGADTFAVTAGALPAGLSLNPYTGAITGTPTSTSGGSFTITATDAVGAAASHSYAVAVNAALSITTAGLINWTVNKSGYSQTISASGGTGAYAFSVTAGSLPTGL